MLCCCFAGFLVSVAADAGLICHHVPSAVLRIVFNNVIASLGAQSGKFRLCRSSSSVKQFELQVVHGVFTGMVFFKLSLACSRAVHQQPIVPGYAQPTVADTFC